MVSKIFEMISIEIVLMILKKISKRFEIVSERFEVVLKRFEMVSERFERAFDDCRILALYVLLTLIHLTGVHKRLTLFY